MAKICIRVRKLMGQVGFEVHCGSVVTRGLKDNNDENNFDIFSQISHAQYIWQDWRGKILWLIKPWSSLYLD